jgi:hypothetical protein
MGWLAVRWLPKTRSMTAAFSAEPDLKYLAEVSIEACPSMACTWGVSKNRPAGDSHPGQVTVFSASNVNTSGGVPVKGLRRGTYTALWTLTDGNGDTRTATTQFIEES